MGTTRWSDEHYRDRANLRRTPARTPSSTTTPSAPGRPGVPSTRR